MPGLHLIFDAGKEEHQNGINPQHQQSDRRFDDAAAPIEACISRDQVDSDAVVGRHYQAYQPPAPVQFQQYLEKQGAQEADQKPDDPGAEDSVGHCQRPEAAARQVVDQPRSVVDQRAEQNDGELLEYQPPSPEPAECEEEQYQRDVDGHGIDPKGGIHIDRLVQGGHRCHQQDRDAANDENGAPPGISAVHKQKRHNHI